MLGVRQPSGDALSRQRVVPTHVELRRTDGDQAGGHARGEVGDRAGVQPPGQIRTDHLPCVPDPCVDRGGQRLTHGLRAFDEGNRRLGRMPPADRARGPVLIHSQPAARSNLPHSPPHRQLRQGVWHERYKQAHSKRLVVHVGAQQTSKGVRAVGGDRHPGQARIKQRPHPRHSPLRPDQSADRGQQVGAARQ